MNNSKYLDRLDVEQVRRDEPQGRGAEAAADSPKPGKIDEIWQAAKVSSVGIEMAVATVLGLLFGRWLDGRFGSDPWFTFLFLGVGLAAAFCGLWRTVAEIQRGFASENAPATPPPSPSRTDHPNGRA